MTSVQGVRKFRFVGDFKRENAFRKENFDGLELQEFDESDKCWEIWEN